MAESTESKGPTILFFGTWYALSYYAPLENYAFLSTCFLMTIGWLALRLAGRASFRLGPKGWLLLFQVALWFGVFLWFAPVTEVTKIVLVWGVGVPLIFMGAGYRLLRTRFPRFEKELEHAPLIAAGTLLLGLPLLARISGSGFLFGLLAAFGLCTMGAIPAYYGWRLAEPLARGERDARFGTEDDYRKAGMFDER
jgi:hypothetical protein